MVAGSWFYAYLLITSLTSWILFWIQYDVWGTLEKKKNPFSQNHPVSSLKYKIPFINTERCQCFGVHRGQEWPGPSLTRSQSDGSFTKHRRSRRWRAAGRRRRGRTWRRSHCRIYFGTPPWEQKTKPKNKHGSVGGWGRGPSIASLLWVAVSLTSGGAGREGRQTGPPSPWGWTRWARRTGQTRAPGIKPRPECSSAGRCASPSSRAPPTALWRQRREQRHRGHRRARPLTGLNTEAVLGTWIQKTKHSQSNVYSLRCNCARIYCLRALSDKTLWFL